MNRSANIGVGCVILFALPFAAGGVFALVAFVRALQTGADGRALFMLGTFALVFSLGGFGLMVAALYGRKNVIRQAELQARHPGQPWLWKEEWANGRVTDSTRGGTIATWVFAIMWNAISSPLLFMLRGELEKNNYFILIALVFPLVGLILLVTAIMATLRALRFHRSTLVLDHVPVPLGGALRGHVEVPYTPLAEATSIVVRLTGIRRTSSGKSSHDSIQWQEEREIPRGSVSRGANGVSIPIAIDVPDDVAPTDDSGPGRMFWRLSVDGEVPGIDYSSTFEVPVFRTAVPQMRAATPALPPPEPREPVDFTMKQTVDGRELRFGRFRARGTAIGALFIALITTAVVIGLFRSDAPCFFPVIFGFCELLIIYFVLDLFFGMSTVTIARERVVIRETLFRTRETTLARTEIAAATAKINGQAGSRPMYEVEVRTQGGKKITAAKYLRHKREAEWVAAQIRGAVDSRP
jgi:hypothetical protein